MTAPKPPAFDTRNPAAWQEALDRRIAEGLEQFIHGLAPDPAPFRTHARADAEEYWAHFAAALLAGRRRGLREEPLRAYIRHCLGVPIVFYRVPRPDHPMDPIEYLFGETLSLNPRGVAALARRLGVQDMAKMEYARMKAFLTAPDPSPDLWAPQAERAREIVEKHRPVFRELAFYDPRRRYSLVRIALALLDTLRHGIPVPPGKRPRGKPPDPDQTMVFVLETYLFPALPTPGQALAKWIPRPGKQDRRRAMQAAREALGLSLWHSPRDVVVKLLAAIGNTRATSLLRRPGSVWDKRPLARSRRSAAASRSQGKESEVRHRRLHYPGDVALVHAGLVRFVFGGPFADALLKGKTKLWLVPKRKGLRAEDPFA